MSGDMLDAAIVYGIAVLVGIGVIVGGVIVGGIWLISAIVGAA